MLFRRSAAPVREVLNAIIRREVSFVSEEAIVHFQDLYDRLLRVIDLIESQRDLLTGLLEADLAVISNRLNGVMKKMTSWGAILIVATLIASIYGMNFANIPALHWEYGYEFALGLDGRARPSGSTTGSNAATGSSSQERTAASRVPRLAVSDPQSGANGCEPGTPARSERPIVRLRRRRGGWRRRG